MKYSRTSSSNDTFLKFTFLCYIYSRQSVTWTYTCDKKQDWYKKVLEYSIVPHFFLHFKLWPTWVVSANLLNMCWYISLNNKLRALFLIIDGMIVKRFLLIFLSEFVFIKNGSLIILTWSNWWSLSHSLKSKYFHSSINFRRFEKKLLSI